MNCALNCCIILLGVTLLKFLTACALVTKNTESTPQAHVTSVVLKIAGKITSNIDYLPTKFVEEVADLERIISYDELTKTLIWNSNYHSERYGNSSKNYKLVALDSDRGAYQIDEGGGLTLDTFFTGDALFSLFSIAAAQGNPGVQMHSLERVVGDTLTIDFTTFPLSGRTSGMGVTTFQLQNVQHCELKKQK